MNCDAGEATGNATGSIETAGAEGSGRLYTVEVRVMGLKQAEIFRLIVGFLQSVSSCSTFL